jgi:hypothetical protein
VDPSSVIEVALVVGAAAGAKDTASTAIKDAYQALKTLVKTRLAGRPAAEVVLAGHEAAPRTWREPLVAELSSVGVDAELLAAAQALLELVGRTGPAPEKYSTDLRGAQGVQVGEHNHQFNVVQNSGTIEGSPFQINIAGPKD